MMKRSKLLFYIIIYCQLLNSCVTFKGDDVIVKNKSCIDISMCYEIMQSENVDNWQTYFGDGETLSKDSVNLCLVDSLVRVFADSFNSSIMYQFKDYHDRDSFISDFKMNIEEYCIQIVPYVNGDKIELLLSCLEGKRISDINKWRKEYFAMLHERGISHFYLTINQTDRKVTSFKP